MGEGHGAAGLQVELPVRPLWGEAGMDPETGWRPGRREKPEAQAGRRESQVRSRQVLGGP